jgi:small-conductance mechanosensitive channel
MQEQVRQLLEKWQLTPTNWNLIIIGVSILLAVVIRLLLSVLVRKNADTKEKFAFFRSFFRHLGKPLNFFIPLFVFNLLMPVMRMAPAFMYRLNRAVEIGLIISFAWLLIQGVKLVQEYVHHRIDIRKSDNLRQRRIMTQLLYIRQVINIVIVLVTIGAVLLTFSSMRKIGTGLLTGVGIGGIIIGFAAQRSLGNLLAGFQIAFTQPFRIDDELLVEGEFGRVEEITLTYVVLHIWDDRRLVLPINYFIEKPFQNWTRTTSQIQGSVLLYVDYMIPVQPIREELERLLKNHTAWDGKQNSLLVTNASERTIELRAHMSALSSGNLFNLRCYVRENLVRFINEKFPGHLPKTRTVVDSDDLAASGNE